jgi:GTP-binding protein
MTTTATERRTDVRNIAIIAHVDHGKTTLVDAMFNQTGAMGRDEEASGQSLDSNDLEKERGITILSKCTSVRYDDKTINIVDTPGHADFGSEVERVLQMVDGVLLVVDAREGAMPQTKFVLRKAVEQGLPPIVVINKMDREHIRPAEVLDEISMLLIDLGADDKQLDFPVLYASAKSGWASNEETSNGKDLTPLFEAIVKHVPSPPAEANKPLQMQITMLDHSNYLGRIAIGRILRGSVRMADPISLVKPNGKATRFKVTQLMDFAGLGRREIQEARAGDIIALAGATDADVGDTIASPDAPEALPALKIDNPTMSMEFSVNDSPFAGQDGKFLTSRHLAERLDHEGQINVGMNIEVLPGEGRFKVSGRGELHLSILIETMRREGYEISVSRPEVILIEEDGVTKEPTEFLLLEVNGDFQGPVFENLGRRGAKLKDMTRDPSGLIKLEYVIPARCLLGFKSEFLTMTKGTGIMYHSFHGYAPKSGESAMRKNGVLIAKENGDTTGYALANLQDRSTLFVDAAVPVYEGMIVGENSREVDMVVNPCKAKALTNMRSKSSDDALALTPPRVMSLEQTIEFIGPDELVEVTPEHLRMRKKILNRAARKRVAIRSET